MPLERLMARLDRIETHLGLRPETPRPAAPFYGHTAASGMHHLKDEWRQWASLVAQCNWLNDELDLAIGATLAMAPDRPAMGLDFCLQQRTAEQRPQNGPERQLEWDLYNRWGLGLKLTPEGQPDDQDRGNAEHPLFSRLVGFQVPLFDNINHEGWAFIDLVGITAEGAPVIIELKRIDANDTPQRVIMEGIAYAIALRKVWAGFYAELAPLMNQHHVNVPLQQFPQNFHVCLLAPQGNWGHWLDTIQQFPGSHECLTALFQNLGQRGLVLQYGSITDQQNLHLAEVPQFP